MSADPGRRARRRDGARTQAPTPARTAPATTQLVEPSRLQEFVRRVLVAVSVNERGADVIAEALVEADLRGVQSHGVALLPRYVHGFRSSELNGRPRCRIVRHQGAVATMDGDNGLGHVVGTKAMRVAIRLAGANGVGLCAVRNSNHFGAAAFYAMRAAAAGMIGFATTNAPPVMAPWGGRQRLLGNNPVCFAIPRGEGAAPIVLDMACTVVARGQIRMAGLRGERIPMGWATDADGSPTDDPAEALRGLLLPAAGPKGYGLAVIAEILAAGLSGAAMAPAIPDGPGERYLAQHLGHLMMAVDISAFSGTRGFRRRVDAFADAMTSSPTAPDTAGIYLPGEIEASHHAQALLAGIELAGATVTRLEALGSELGVGWTSDGVV